LKKTTRAELQNQIDDLKALAAWVNAEQNWYLLNAFAVLTNAINVVVWLHDERGWQLQQFIDSEQRLIARARAVKAAKTQTGVPS